MTVKKIIFGTISIMVLAIIFSLLDNGGKIVQIDQIISPLVFALAAVGSMRVHTIRRIFLIISLSLLAFMVITYLLNRIDIANWLGSLGFGIFFVTIISYLPKCIKDGNIDKF